MSSPHLTSPAKERLALAALALIVLAGCKREERAFRVQPPESRAVVDSLRLSNLQPGPPAPSPRVENELEENAHALAEGKRLYAAFNCNGCHANGGGDKGPALMDEKWIYGGAPAEIFASIMQGRPNGMPSFHGKLPEHQAWQIAAYVRSLSGQVPFDAAPARNDHMKANPPENSVDPIPPRDAGSPK